MRHHSARLTDSLSNPGGPLIRLIEAVAEGSHTATSQVTAIEDPAVATQVNENRILSRDEVAELVEEYRRGATLRGLSRRFGVHRATVDRHLERAGVAKRPQVKMTPDRVAQAVEFYGQGWSTQRIGRELYVSASTVCQALKRAGVKMRPPVA